MSSFKIEVTSTVVPSQIQGGDKGVYQSCREGAKPVAADGNLEEKVMKNSRGRNAFARARPQRAEVVKKGQRL